MRGTIDLRRFYARRALRLLPALILVVLSVVVWAHVFSSNLVFMHTLRDSISVILYFWNFVVTGWPANRESHRYMFIHLWSLSVEEQFYLLWPLALIVAFRLRLSRQAQLAILVAGLLLPAIVRPFLWTEATWFAIYVRPDLRADALLWGVIVAWLLDTGRRPNARLKAWLKCGAVSALLILIFVSLQPGLHKSGFHYFGGFTIVGLCSATLVFSAASSALSAPLRSVFGAGLLCLIGRLSYGLYLWHHPVNLAFIYEPLWLKTVVTFGVASISYYALEAPFLRLKDRIGHSGIEDRDAPRWTFAYVSVLVSTLAAAWIYMGTQIQPELLGKDKIASLGADAWEQLLPSARREADGLRLEGEVLPTAYGAVSMPYRLPKGALVAASGTVRRGGIVLGLLDKSGSWAATKAISTGAFRTAIEAPVDGDYRIVIANNLPAGQTTNDVQVDEIGLGTTYPRPGRTSVGQTIFDGIRRRSYVAA